jgi:hypothetical protein
MGFARSAQAVIVAVVVSFILNGCGGGGGSGSVTSSTGGGGISGPVAGGGTYDDRVGLGTDSSGVPVLEKHANARYIYWNPSDPNANDANAGTDPTRPKRTPASAWSALRSGYGDWLLMAQGATYSGGFGSLADRSGLNAQYPIVVTTYDPSDPTNVSKMRQGKVTMGTDPTERIIQIYNFSGQYIVFENLDLDRNFSSAQIPEAIYILHYQNSGTKPLYVLFHNVRALRMQVTLQGDSGSGARVDGVIFRHCAFAYSSQPSSASGHAQGMYMWYTGDVTIEDSIFYHNGWSNDGTRDTASHTPDIYKHNAYFGDKTYGTIFRRNVSGHASSHGLQLRGGGIAHDNVFASNPINLIIGGGDNYNVDRPEGVPYDVRNNVIVGSSDIDSSTKRGFGVGFENTQDGGLFAQNIVANVGSLATGNIQALSSTWISVQYNLPTYMNFDNNIFWRWNSNYTTNVYANGDTLDGGLYIRSYPSQLHFTHTNDIIHFDTSPDGTNRQFPQTAFPDAGRTIASYATTNGYASEAALWDAMVTNPKAGWAKSIGDYIRAGFGR